MLGRFTEDLTALQRAIRWGDGDTLVQPLHPHPRDPPRHHRRRPGDRRRRLRPPARQGRAGASSPHSWTRRNLAERDEPDRNQAVPERERHVDRRLAVCVDRPCTIPVMPMTVASLSPAPWWSARRSPAALEADQADGEVAGDEALGGSERAPLARGGEFAARKLQAVDLQCAAAGEPCLASCACGFVPRLEPRSSAVNCTSRVDRGQRPLLLEDERQLVGERGELVVAAAGRAPRRNRAWARPRWTKGRRGRVVAARDSSPSTRPAGPVEAAQAGLGGCEALDQEAVSASPSRRRVDVERAREIHRHRAGPVEGRGRARRRRRRPRSPRAASLKLLCPQLRSRRSGKPPNAGRRRSSLRGRPALPWRGRARGCRGSRRHTSSRTRAARARSRCRRSRSQGAVAAAGFAIVIAADFLGCAGGPELLGRGGPVPGKVCPTRPDLSHMSDFWVFGYGSLMWRPGFDPCRSGDRPSQRRAARALRLFLGASRYA